MRRVVVTGMGMVSCLGNDLDSVSRARSPKDARESAPRRDMQSWDCAARSPEFRRSSSTSTSIVATCASWEMPPPLPLSQ